ncbi:FAD-dependent oxidoreductase [Geodermatophilus sp. CPCC 205506]|uniref:FAD-dependent oxidoreductase n=1 Tax=Geodermatophilus sp. CPCC 205506 TaxID=2936596 RepID=UPI003EEFD5B8
MSDLRVEVAVVGAGLMGAATAWELSRRGVSVALVEAFDPGHRHGSSHGTSRIVRRAYADPFYVRLTARAMERWAEAEADTGTTLLRSTGGLDHGRARDPVGLAGLMLQEGVPHELLSAAEAQARWPGMRFDGPVLFHPQAGVLDADAAVAAWVRRVGELGGVVLRRTRVLGIEPAGDGVLLRTDGPAIAADRVVVAAGPWLPELAPALGVPVGLPPLTVTQQQVFHFRLRDPGAAWPTFVHKGQLQLFGLPSGADGGSRPAFKVAQHDGGTPTTASGRDGVVDPASRERVAGYVAEFLPGLDPEPVAEASCLYTTTPTEDFVLDRVGPVVVVSPCSGHGAKFAALVGVLAADLVLGRGSAEPRFALAAAAVW